MTNAKPSAISRPTGETQLHLYLAWGCPSCHRVLATLALTGLEDHVTYTWMRNANRKRPPVNQEVSFCFLNNNEGNRLWMTTFKERT